jgi:hypothetical protein
MNEFLLQYLWKFRLYRQDFLYTTTGEPVEVVQVGVQNTDAGPDFINAKIRISGMLWGGNVEVHCNASDWNKHKHYQDACYNNVVLHVVYRSDQEVFTNNKNLLPTLELRGRIDEHLINHYHLLMKSKKWVPCEGQESNIHPTELYHWQTRILIERLERKSSAIIAQLKSNLGDWEETFYQWLSMNFGFTKNKLPFQMLSRMLPLKLLLRERNTLFNIEALLFGQAGLLKESHAEAYPKALLKQFKWYQNKYRLAPIDHHLWTYFRLYPSGFPELRIAQLACVMHQRSLSIASLLDARTPKAILNTLRVNPSSYWTTHYRFDRPVETASCSMGEEGALGLMLNAIIPFLYAYGLQFRNTIHQEKAIEWLEQLPEEKNLIIRKWKKMKFTISSSFLSQSMIELKNEYCSNKKCLNCGIGMAIFKS